MKWLLLVLAICLEVCGTTSMKLSNGFTVLVPSILMFCFYAASLVTLNISLKHLSVGVAYAIWSGIGMVLISVINVLFFKSPLSLIQIASIGVIILGVIGLNIGGGVNH